MPYSKNSQNSQDSKLLHLFVFANNSLASLKEGMSGGDRIFLQLVAGLTHFKYQITLFCGANTEEIFTRNGISNIDYNLYKKQSYSVYKTDFLTIIKKLFYACLKAVSSKKYYGQGIIYITSDFWPDLLPAFIYKIKNPNLPIIASFFQFVSPPWKRYSPYKGKRIFIGLLYFISQLPAYILIKFFATAVIVTSAPDIQKFVGFGKTANDIYVVQGGVDTDAVKGYQKLIEKQDIIYDACFSGRLHPQKGLVVLISIWEKLLNFKHDAKLVIIGNGPMELELKQIVRKKKLDSNIFFVGFIDGLEKYKIFAKSKIIVHPATYDSGGMAAAEAMAWGLPGISFDLESLKTYYPQGVIKVPCFDENIFASKIFDLLTNQILYSKLSHDAKNLIFSKWSWNSRSKEFDLFIRSYV